MTLADTVAPARGPARVEELPSAAAARVASGTWTVSCPLPGTFDALRTARLFVRGVLGGWHLDGLRDDVVLVAHELVANALRHGVGLGAPGRSGAVSGANGAAAFPVQLSLVRTGTRLVVVVDDPGTGVPVRRAPDTGAGHGRGLQLIESLSMTWGWTPLERGGHPVGKEVWAAFDVRAVDRSVARAG